MPRAKKEPKTPAPKIKDAMDIINKKYGDGSSIRLGSSKSVSVKTASTGNVAIDLASGVGGLPKGRIVEVYGPESSGKTTFCLSAVAQVQKAGGTACFVDVEHALDPKWAETNGVRVKDLIFSQPDCGEDALNMVEDYVRGGADIVVIDSVAALVSRSELNGEMGDATVGVQARMMSQAMRKLTSIVSKSDCIVVFTNQIRMKIGVMFGSPETTPGGRALPFFASMRLDVRRIGKIKGASDAIVGSRTRMKFVKNKVAAPFTECEFDIMYDEGISSSGSLIDIAVAENIIEKKGSWFSFNGEMIGQGRETTRQILRSDPDLYAKIEKMVTDQVKAEVGHTLGAQEVESGLE